MKIINLSVHSVSSPARHLSPAPAAGVKPIQTTLIEIETDSGIVGFGECFRLAPGAIRSLVMDEFAAFVLGRNASHINSIVDDIKRFAMRISHHGLVSIAIGGIELALWDILGKSCAKPLFEMVGGACGPKLRAYASMPRYSGPAECAEATLGFLAEGYTAVKLHQNEVAFAAAVRDAAGADAIIMFDAGGAWEPLEAVGNIEALADLDVLWVEEPLRRVTDYKTLATLTSRQLMLIAGGENEYTTQGFLDPISRRAFDLIQPDVIKCGGISETRQILALANAYNVQAALHSFCHGPGVAATTHISAADPAIQWVEINPLAQDAGYMTSVFPDKSGEVVPPALPGLGIEIDRAWLKGRADSPP